MLSNLPELPETVLSSFSSRGARPHVVLSLSNDPYSHSRDIAEQLSIECNKHIVRIPQYINEYEIDKYLSSAFGCIIFLPFVSQRSKQTIARVLKIVHSTRSRLVIGADFNDLDHLNYFANLIDYVSVGKHINNSDFSSVILESALERIASAAVEKNVELLRRSGSSESEILSYVIIGQLLLRRIEISSQRNSSNPDDEHTMQYSQPTQSTTEYVFEELNIILRELTERKKYQRNTSVSHGFHTKNRGKRVSPRGQPNQTTVQKSAKGMFSLYNTLIAAAPYQNIRREHEPNSSLGYMVEIEDIRRFRMERAPSRLEILILDSSGSMSGRERIRYAKGLLRSLVQRGYKRRSYCSLVVARSHESKVLVEPTRRTTLILESLKRIPTGGKTPLYDALSKSLDIVKRFKRSHGTANVHISILTDGKDTSEKGYSDGVIKYFMRERISCTVFDTCLSQSSTHFAKEIGATHHVIERAENK